MGFVYFQQISGKRHKLQLEGHAAPHGRPRQSPVVTDAIEVRNAEVYYGDDTVPTRHLFGVKYPPIELNGRFSDRRGGAGFKKAKVEEVREFIKEQQSVQFVWADVVSVVGIITHFETARESVHECTWKLTMKVDLDEFANRKKPVPKTPSPQDFSDKIKANFVAGSSIFHDVPDLGGSIFDAIDSVVNAVTSPVREFNDVASDMKSFAKSTTGELSRITNVVGNLRTATYNMREAFASLPASVALIRENASSNMRLWMTQTTIEESMRVQMAAAAEADRAARAALSGRDKTSYVVHGGDTWESIAVQFYGSPGAAAKLQLANGAIGGQPKQGLKIRIPA